MRSERSTRRWSPTVRDTTPVERAGSIAAAPFRPCTAAPNTWLLTQDVVAPGSAPARAAAGVGRRLDRVSASVLCGNVNNSKWSFARAELLEAVERLLERPGTSTPSSVNAGTACTVTAVTTPSAPMLTRAARQGSGRRLVELDQLPVGGS